MRDPKLRNLFKFQTVSYRSYWANAPILPIELISRQTFNEMNEPYPMEPLGAGELDFVITGNGDRGVSVIRHVRANTQRRAEQLMLAWMRARWFRDTRKLHILEVKLVD